MTNMLNHLRIIRFSFTSLLLTLSLFGCGGGGNNESVVVPISENQKFKQFLYSDPQASLEYVTDSNMPADGDVARAAFTASGIDASGYSTNLIRINYLNNNLPQYAIHIVNSINSKLLVYNHGHGGLPGAGEDFARQLIRGLLDQGYDVLLTSMPLVGLNAVDTATTYWAKVYGQPNPVVLQQRIDNTMGAFSCCL